MEMANQAIEEAEEHMDAVAVQHGLDFRGSETNYKMFLLQCSILESAF